MIAKCSTDELCGSLGDRLVDRGSGFYVYNTCQRGGNDIRMLGVAYKRGAKDRGLLLNVCPFCGGQPGYFNREIARQESSHDS